MKTLKNYKWSTVLTIQDAHEVYQGIKLISSCTETNWL